MANPQQLEDLAIGQAAVNASHFGYVDTMALKCVVKLGIPDIISSHGHPISLVQIMDSINHSSQFATSRLGRVMTILVRRGIFTETPSDSGDAVYGLTAASELLLSSSDKSFACRVASKCSEVFLPLWEHLNDYVKDGSNGFTKLYGMDAYSFLSARPELFAAFQKNAACVTNIVMEALKVGYLNYGLKGVRALIDVGGGYGTTIADIVKEFPHVKGINFDLPAVVAAAPEYPGVTHVAGDMFISIPSADAVMMKKFVERRAKENVFAMVCPTVLSSKYLFCWKGRNQVQPRLLSNSNGFLVMRDKGCVQDCPGDLIIINSGLVYS